MPVHHMVLASGAVVAVSVAVATMIAVYESPEFRRYTEDVRRRFATMLDSVSDSVNPPYRPPRFNRPEDAEGFFLSRREGGAEPGVDGDEESCRRQREELLYWNAVRMEKQRQSQSRGTADAAENEKISEKRMSAHDSPRPSVRHRGSSFDDFLRPDENGEKGSYVFNSGADVNNHAGLRHRGGARGVVAPPSGDIESLPLVDERRADLHGIGEDATRQIAIPSESFEIMSDIYSATTLDREEPHALRAVGTGSFAPPTAPSPLVNLAAATAIAAAAAAAPPSIPSEPPSEASATVDRDLPTRDAISTPQDERREVFASIQAWAHHSSRDFYSPLPVTPVAPVSEPELLSESGFSEDFSEAGEPTPIDSLSLAGSGEDVGTHLGRLEHAEGGSGAHELVWQHPAEDEGGRPFDVLSESEGMATPASWSEVGSVISESEAFAPRS